MKPDIWAQSSEQSPRSRALTATAQRGLLETEMSTGVRGRARVLVTGSLQSTGVANEMKTKQKPARAGQQVPLSLRGRTGQAALCLPGQATGPTLRGAVGRSSNPDQPTRGWNTQAGSQ